MDAQDLAQAIAQYVGGQLEIQHHTQHYLYRGEIKSVEIGTGENEGELVIKFKWLAKMGENGEWQNETDLDYAISMDLAYFSRISDNRIYYEVAIVDEFGTFFPPDGTKLDPKKVNGLVLA